MLEADPCSVLIVDECDTFEIANYRTGRESSLQTEVVVTTT